MSLTDPVADFLARIRNAIRARHQKLDVPASKLKTEIARILKEEGYISNYKTQEEEGKLILLSEAASIGTKWRELTAGFAYHTSQSSSPPTPSRRAWRPVITPFGVVMIEMPRPPCTRLISSRPM